MSNIQTAVHDGWDEPVSFDSYTLPPFPIQNLPSILSDISRSVSDVTQTAIDAAGVASLSMISVATARKFVVDLSEGLGWTEQNNLYTVIAMPAGERKSSVFNILSKPILDYEMMIQQQSYRETDESEEPKRLARLVADDVTPQALAELLEVNHERMAVLSTEPSLFDMLSHKQYGKPVNLDVHLKCFTWDRITIDRKKDRPIILEQPCLTMCLFAQPSALQGLPARLTGRGFLGRILYSLPPSRRGMRDITLKSVPVELVTAYRDILYRLLQFESTRPIPLILSKEALEIFQEYRAGFEPRLKAGGDLSYDFLSSWTERLPGQLLRIAATFHSVLEATKGPVKAETLDKTISAETMTNALAFSEYFIEHAKAVFGCIRSDETNEDAKYLLDVLKRKKIHQYKRQQLWAAIKGKFHSAEPFDSALEVLKDRGYIRVETIKSQRGRSGAIIECNPNILTS